MAWNAYIDDKVTEIAAIPGINYCERAALIDPDRIMRINRWPMALVQSEGLNIDPFNGVICGGLLGVTLVTNKSRGLLGSAAIRELGTISEAVIAALTGTRDGAVMLWGVSEEAGESVDGNNEIYMVKLIFSYDLLRV